MELTERINSLFILRMNFIVLFIIGGLFFKVSIFFSVPFSFFIVLSGNVIVLTAMYILFKKIELFFNNLSFNNTDKELKHEINAYFEEVNKSIKT